MDSALPATTLRCTQCSGELHPDEGQIFLTCPFCSSTVYVDKSRVVFHWYVAPTIDEAKARGQLARWMAGNDTVKDLDKKSQIAGQAFQYFPMWYFRHAAGGRDVIELEPAAATTITELRKLSLPAGDLRKYEPALDSQAQPPTVPLPTALGWLAGRGVPAAALAETALVHVPIFIFKYVYKNQSYTALVEAATGRVMAGLFPTKAEAPYQIAGCLTAATFLALTSLPVFGSFFGVDGLSIGLAVCAGLGCLATPVLFAAAAWVAARV